MNTYYIIHDYAHLGGETVPVYLDARGFQTTERAYMGRGQAERLAQQCGGTIQYMEGTQP